MGTSYLTAPTKNRVEIAAAPAAKFFACLLGILAAVVQVGRTNLTWLVAQTQPTMSLRVILVMISGILAIVLAPLAASTAKRLGGAWLVATLAFLVVPLSIGMSIMADGGSVLVSHILIYGIGLALIQAFTYSAHDEFLNRLVGSRIDSFGLKTVAVRLRNAIQFIGRIFLWICLGIGAFSLTGVRAARSTYLFEACFYSCFGLMVITLLKRAAAHSSSRKADVEASSPDNIGKEPWQWNHPLLGVFVLEFALNCCFLGGLMLPRLLPDKSLSTLYFVMSAGALGAMVGSVFTRMTRMSLWRFVFVDLLLVLFMYSVRSTIAIGIAWCLANMCYGATDTIFARAVQAGASDRTANLASLRRVLMGGIVGFVLYGIVQIQSYFHIGDRPICFISLGITCLLVSFCCLKRDWINRALDVAVHS